MKDRIEIVSASAGSGKTHKLAALLEEELAAERVRPENVVATTFTRRAAAELQSRARRHLLRAGRVDDAQALAAARIGTVHAVCGRIVNDYALELGLSPDVGVLDEVAAQIAFRRALTGVIDSSREAELLDAICQRFTGTAPRGASQAQWKHATQQAYDWRAAVGDVIEHARMNGLGQEEFDRCAQRSVESMLALLSVPTETAEALDQALLEALQHFVDTAPCPGDETRTTQEALRTCWAVLPRLKRGAALQWVEWPRLSKIAPGKKSRSAAEPLAASAAAHDRHPRLRADLETLIRGVFAIAKQAVDRYAEYKRDRGVMDFGDHEVLALKALRLPAVRAELSTELDLVLVDEFQDTSPLQLAIFLELATLAPRSVWVGDQKQSIYGFRGADPALMDSVIEAILGDAEPETLKTSFRSRPQLVELCSELFAHSFISQGIGPAQVRLSPSLSDEPEGLGPCVERWNLVADNKGDDCDAVAGLVQELLNDPSVRVRDPHTGEVRSARPGDVAVMCRYNDTCDRIAHALAARNLSADLRRTGLLTTLEAHFVLAGLALFVHPDDRAAAARIARLLQEDPSASAWLDAALASGESDALMTHPTVRRVLAAREEYPHAGPLLALDLVLNAVGANEHALRWGDSGMRLANLDALRDHAAALMNRTSDEGEAWTPLSLLEALRDLAASGDTRALLGDGDGVVVSTWHATKGLEWPITVLLELEVGEKFHPFDVKPVTDRESFSFDDPLDGRWVRFWPNPYGGQKKDVPLLERLEHHPATAATKEMSRRETLRVLYVAMTRARDRLIFAAREGKLPASDLKNLVGADNQVLIAEPQLDQPTHWAGVKLQFHVRAGAPQEALHCDPTPGCAPRAAGAVQHADAFLSPSAIEARGTVVGVHQIGPRLVIQGEADMQALGEALHGFFAADQSEMDEDARLALAEGLLQRWGVASHLSAQDAVQASSALRAWGNKTYAGAAWHRELALQHRLQGGTIMRGTADLVLLLRNSGAIIDHKSFPGGRDQAAERAATFSGQLKAYAAAVRASFSLGELDTWVHLPVSGLIVQLA